jgi:hypothetical protein
MTKWGGWTGGSKRSCSWACCKALFKSLKERPEDLQRTLAELASTAREEGRRRVLMSYLEAITGCLREGPEVGEGEIGTGADYRERTSAASM